MHPAKSVILFTTASGAGYGLIAWFGLFGAFGLLPAELWMGLLGFGIGFGLIVLGLLSSTFHLGHPERAWRALSQWRSSWLSREGVAAVFTFLPAGLFALAWVLLGRNDGLAGLIGLLASLSCVVTVACTAMIYASLRTIRAWHSAWTLPIYLLMAALSGALLLQVFLSLWQVPLGRVFPWAILILFGLTLGAKLLYWRSLASEEGGSTAESATGLGDLGKVRLLEAPHSESNYLMQEMGFRIARRHAEKLRRIVLLAGFCAPALLILLALLMPGVPGVVATLIAVALFAAGLVVERWLFFAEAKHVVTLYYGESRA
ncbi:dimethyl sulfoxide reductase anchor subunit [Pelagibius litoralis]|uniref:Dimethyl sulfoxide reductase anchor subunit n=1 Tax=Pelagibius litoralis TaxID=374515 RepID=A0A967EX35_9PROT|nr:DmsC/YnfH family molybdoenzyme membrane anchor subunit [Pelagibius litoralis]NIA67490.1 dimethyl sulfoxide reductase anchor subunit [Pelagibius litoralis]